MLEDLSLNSVAVTPSIVSISSYPVIFSDPDGNCESHFSLLLSPSRSVCPLICAVKIYHCLSGKEYLLKSCHVYNERGLLCSLTRTFLPSYSPLRTFSNSEKDTANGPIVPLPRISSLLPSHPTPSLPSIRWIDTDDSVSIAFPFPRANVQDNTPQESARFCPE